MAFAGCFELCAVSGGEYKPPHLLELAGPLSGTLSPAPGPTRLQMKS